MRSRQARPDPPPHLPLSPSPQGRRGNAGGTGLLSLSAPEPSERSERPATEGYKKVGGEGRGEVGVFSFGPLREDVR